MKPLIAIVTCESRSGYAAAQRATWVRQAGSFDVRFFLAQQERPALADEVFLDCGDSYMDLPAKVRELFRWARTAGYREVLKADDDVLLFPRRIQVPAVEYLGRRPEAPDRNWCAGMAYWLTGDAIAAVAESDLRNENHEDRWVGTSLLAHGIRLTPAAEIIFLGKSPHPQRPLRPNFRAGWWRENRARLRKAYALGEFSPREMPAAYAEFS